MSVDRKSARAIFEQAIEKSSAELSEYLDSACGEDADLRKEVDALLRSHQEAGGFLGGSDSRLAPTEDRSSPETAAHTAVVEGPGTQIGPYKLLQGIGLGGMGVVYMAEQRQPVKRQVALKIIKPGMDTQQVIARFEAERQALALMDHPNIAKVLDAGATESGRPYFVMELVHGVPITEYCDEKQLAPEERLSLFISICEAVQHAHQKGIVHRDLKPGNVLVTRYDERPVPKVIDFGIAKATGQSLTEKTMFTQFGHVVGTLEYMSPEQAEPNQLDIDTRSDVYSLGVLLYELLTGTTPHEKKRLRSAAFDEMLRIIREEEPPKPSTRLSSMESLPSVAASRGTEPRKLSSFLKGDLDWIVMKALEKERGRRYETANAFAADVRRCLADEPVLASPPTAVYRFRKFARRNKALLATAAMIAAALVAGLIGTTWQWLEARAAADRANIMRLTSQAESIRDELPVTSVNLALETVRMSRQTHEGMLPIAHGTLLNMVQNVGGRPLGGVENTGAAAIHPHGKWAVTAGPDGARLWRLNTDPPASSAIPLPGAATSGDSIGSRTGFSPNGRWLVIAGAEKDPPVQLWDLRLDDPAEHHFSLLGHREGITSIAWAGERLVTASKDQTVRVWDLTSDAGPKPFVVLPHNSNIRAVATNAKGRWLATAVEGDTATLWDLDAEDPAASAIVLIEQAKGIWSMALSPDGRWLAAASPNRAVYLWNLEDEDPAASPFELRGHKYGTNHLAISPDSRWLVTGSTDTTARLWDLSAPDPSTTSRVLQGHTRIVWALAISPDSRWLVTAAEDATARLWDLAADDPAASSLVLRGHDYGLRGLAISPDSRVLATGAQDRTVRIWDLKKPDPSSSPIVLRAHERSASALAIGPEGRWLVSGRGDFRLWDLAEKNPASSLVLLNEGPIQNSMELSTDGKRHVTVGKDGSLQVWRFAPSDDAPFKLLHVLNGHVDEVMSIAISGHYVASGGQDGKARLWDLKTRSASPRVFARPGGSLVWYVALSPNGRWLATGDASSNAELWDLSKDEPAPQRLEGYRNLGGKPYKHPIAMSPDGNWLAMSLGSAIRLYDLLLSNPVSSPIQLPELQHPVTASHPEGSDRRIARLTFSPDGSRLVTQHQNGVVGLWDLSDAIEDGNWRVLSDHTRDVYVVAFGPSRERLLTVSWGGEAYIRSLVDLTKRPISLASTSGSLFACAFSPDGSKVVTGGQDKLARVWHLENPRVPYLVLRGHTSHVNAISFLDDRWILTRSNDRTVRLWDLDLPRLTQRARKLAGRELTIDERQEYSLDLLPR